MYAPREKVPLLGLSIVMRGVCARAGGILTPISTWGEDVIVTAPALRDKRPVSALTYVEIALLTRENFDEVLAGFPESARVIKNADGAPAPLDITTTGRGVRLHREEVIWRSRPWPKTLRGQVAGL